MMDKERLYNNLLSSQPLCFNFFSNFYIDKNTALRFHQKFYPEITEVSRIHFEYGNSNNKFDNSAG